MYRITRVGAALQSAANPLLRLQVDRLMYRIIDRYHVLIRRCQRPGIKYSQPSSMSLFSMIRSMVQAPRSLARQAERFVP